MLASDDAADAVFGAHVSGHRPPTATHLLKMDSTLCRTLRMRPRWPRWRCRPSLFVAALLVGALLIAGSEAAPGRRTLTNGGGGGGGGGGGAQSSTAVHQHRHHHNSHQQKAKSEPANQCAWMQWESDGTADVAGTRAYLAPVVFEGKARSRSDGPVYRVTFDVVTVFKGDVAGPAPGSQVRLEFAKPADSSALRSLGASSRRSGTAVLAGPAESVAKPASRTRSDSSSSSSSSSSSHTSSSRPRRPSTSNQLHHNSHHRRHQNKCLVTAEIRTGRHYLVFANRWGPNNFTAFGSPIVPTKKSLKDVRSTLCPRCARAPAAFGLDESVTVKKSQRLILRCRTRGNPVPAVVWYKDGKPLPAAGSTKRVRIKTKRRRSTLRIRCVKEEDAGVYECRPNNVLGQGTAARSVVTVVKSQPTIVAGPSTASKQHQTAIATRPANGSTSSGLWPLIGVACPIDSFCMNGGTCRYFEAVGELVCQCAEGYKGQRCENKDIYNLGKKCKGGQLVGNKCVPSYGPVIGMTLGGTPIEIGGLGPTAAAGWAAVPGSPHVRWWHLIRNGQQLIGVSEHPNQEQQPSDEDQCPDDPDDA